MWRGVLLAACVALGEGIAAPTACAAPTPDANGQAYAAQILEEAVLPPSAQATSTVVTPQLDVEPQAVFLPNADQYDAHAFYVVDLLASSVLLYIQDHLPRGWSVAFTEPPSGPPPPGETVVEVSVPVSGVHDQDARVSYSLVADGNGTEIRVDGQVVWNPSRAPGEDVPSIGAVEVTGYAMSSLMQGSTGPVRIRVGGAEAKLLRKEFNGLSLAAPSGCMENETAYAITFMPERDSRPTVRATAESCPSPGVVQVTSGVKQLPTLKADCALARAVVAVLPHGKASFTRQEARLVCSGR